MKILHVMATVNEEYGGPVAALQEADAVTRLRGVTRTVATLDLPSDPWVRRSRLDTVPLGSALARQGRRTLPWLRYGFTPHLVPWLRRHAGCYDRVVVNGLWNYAAFAARRVLPRGPTPYVVVPHGMLDPWFRTAYPLKHRCKQLSWWASEGPLLHGARAVLFTSDGERAAAADAFRPYRVRGIVTGYGTGDAQPATREQAEAFAAAVPALGTRPFLLFLGRLHPKKGCDLLLRAFAANAARLADHHLVMAGPDADGWRAALQNLSAAVGIAPRVHWPGMLRDSAKWGALHGCDAFVLPSHGENFGVAVAEALSCGKPVVVTTKVNIAGEIEADGAGLIGPDTEAGVTNALGRFAALAPCDRDAMGRRARTCFDDRFQAARVAIRTLAVLQNPEAFL